MLASGTANAQQGNVDTHIAVTDQQDENTYAVIISNEHYQFEEPVPYANNDGATFKLYCEKTLGIPEKNIKYVEDATLNVMKFNLQWLERIMKVKNGEARAFIYYSGHGMPDEDSKKPICFLSMGSAQNQAQDTARRIFINCWAICRQKVL